MSSLFHSTFDIQHSTFIPLFYFCQKTGGMIKIFKFGGASVKDAESVRNVSEIIRKFKGSDKLLCVVSAMGKVTNGLEAVVKEAVDTKGISFFGIDQGERIP